MDEGIRLIEQTLDTNPSCASEPADMLALLAEAYLDTGRPRDAARTHRLAVAALAESPSDMTGARGRRVRLLARGGQVDRAVRAIEADQQYLTGGDTPHSRLAFLRLVGAATHVLRDVHGGRPVRLATVPAGTLAELDDWARAQAEQLAAQFDARNGTTAESDAVARAWRSVPAPLPLDLDVLPRGLAAGTAPAAPGTPGAPAPEPAPAVAADGSGDPLADAERLSAAGDHEAAATAYLSAAAAAERGGLLADSGFLYAEAAHCAQVLGDDDGASSGYGAAVARLRAADVAAGLVAPVVVAWASAAAVTGESELVLAEADRLLAVLGPDTSAEGDGERAPALVARDRAAARRAAADLDDAAARLLATLGGPERSTLAAVRAQRAAEAYGGLGALADAAHAFWLAGRLHDQLGHVDEAVWNLESAMEGFAAARARGPRGEVANVLVDVLRRSGQDARADELARTLTT